MEVIEDRDNTTCGFTRRRRQGIGGRKLALDLMPEERVVSKSYLL